MNEEMQSVMRRIQKLLAIANDARADANEAAAAAGMAERLLRKFQLDTADVLMADLKSKAQRAVRREGFASMKRNVTDRPPVRSVPTWAQHIAVGVARLHECEVRLGFAPRPAKPGVIDACILFFGIESDADVALWTFDYLIGAVLRACEANNAEAARAGRSSKASSEAFRRGFTAALNGSLSAARAEKQRAQTSTGTALVVAKNRAIAEEFGEFKYRDSKRSVTVSDAAAFMRGRAEGSSVDVARRAVGGGTSSQQLRLAA